MMKKTKILCAITAALALIAFQSCRETILLSNEDWAPDVKEGINDLVRLYGNASEKQYAVFDFDNTTSIFDITENEMAYQLQTMSFAMTPERLAEALSTGLDTEDAGTAGYVADIKASYGHLYEKFGPFTCEGLSPEIMVSVMEDPYWEELASKAMNMYHYIYKVASPTVCYNWTKYWCCGMTGEQEYELAVRSHRHFSSIETTSGQWCGKVESVLGPDPYTYKLGFSVTEPLRELWRTLSANGIDVWVCSASGADAVLAAIDMFGLRPYCSGVLSMTIGHDEEGRYSNFYDYDGRASIPAEEGSWVKGNLPTGAQTCGQGKVTAILNSIAPLYGGKGPVACFMDSTGDFNFCTEFESTKLVVCFNRGDRKITGGGGIVAITAIYERDVLGYDLKKANEAGDILYLLQGRDDNGMRSLRPSNATLTLGSTEEKLFAGPEDYALYDSICERGLTVKEILETYSTSFTTDYPGYRSIKDAK